jgi:hypothetical protein
MAREQFVLGVDIQTLECKAKVAKELGEPTRTTLRPKSGRRGVF